jgi:hypothetical protein
MPEDLHDKSTSTPDGASCPIDSAPGAAAQGRAVREEDSTRPAPDRGSARFQASAQAFARNRPVSDLFRELTRDVSTLVRQEAALAKAEMREKMAVYSRNGAIVGVGAVLALGGLLLLLGALSAGLAAWMDASGMDPNVYSWLAPLIVGVVTVTVAAILINRSINRIKSESPTPEKTAQSLREAGEWMKEKIS